MPGYGGIELLFMGFAHAAGSARVVTKVKRRRRIGTSPAALAVFPVVSLVSRRFPSKQLQLRLQLTGDGRWIHS
jgi:hypothetical protein